MESHPGHSERQGDAIIVDICHSLQRASETPIVVNYSPLGFNIIVGMQKRPFLLILFGALLLGAARRPPWRTEPLSAIVDGKSRGFLALVRIDEVPCLSLHDLQKVFGGRVSWRRISRRFTYQLENRNAEFALDGSSTAVINGQKVTLETSVRWWGDTAYLPLSLISTPPFQAFSESRVQWDPSQRSLIVEPVPSVSSPRVYAYPKVTRVSVEIGPQVDYRLLAKRADSLVFRLYNGRAVEGEKLSFTEGSVAAVELRPRARTTDFLITLVPGVGAPEIYLGESPRALIIDVLQGSALSSPDRGPDTPTPGISRAAPILRAPGLSGIVGRPRSDVDAPFLALSPLKTIVIDPGHGGKDPGAIGPQGTLEKDVNLRAAQALAKILEDEGRFRVILTRADDQFMSLEDRSAVANKNKADLFISFHCNAGMNHASQGFEVYYLSEKASDDQAAAVARRENSVVELEGVTGKAREKLEELLWSLARNEFMNDSSEIAAHLARQAEKRLPVANRGVKQAGFYVLRGTSMPAVLVESGFITNAKEEGLLRSARFHRKLADALYAGLLDYEKRKIQTRLAQGPAGGS